MMSLREIVQNYRTLAGGFGRAVALESFALAHDQTEELFGAYEEDYLISRFLHFTLDPRLAQNPNRAYQINGFPQTHVSLDAEIEEIL